MMRAAAIATTAAVANAIGRERRMTGHLPRLLTGIPSSSERRREANAASNEPGASTFMKTLHGRKVGRDRLQCPDSSLFVSEGGDHIRIGGRGPPALCNLS